MAQQQKYKVYFLYVEIIDEQKSLRPKERIVTASSYHDAEQKVKKEFWARGIKIKLYRDAEKV